MKQGQTVDKRQLRNSECIIDILNILKILDLGDLQKYFFIKDFYLQRLRQFLILGLTDFFSKRKINIFSAVKLRLLKFLFYVNKEWVV